MMRRKIGRGEGLGAAALACALVLGACAPEASSPAGGAGGEGGRAGGERGGAGGGGGETVDEVSPSVRSISPADGTTGVAPHEPIVIAFSEPMNEALGTVRIDPGDRTLRASAGAWSADRTSLTLSPSAPLPSGAMVTLTVAVDFEDRAGNAMEAPFTARFETKDVVAPHVVAATPTEGAALVPLTTEQIVITFSEPMAPTTGQLVADGDLVLGEERWVDERTVRYAVSGLRDDRGYALTLEGFRDLAGNPLDPAPHLGDGALDFTTGPDTLKPHATGSYPAEGDQRVYPTEIYDNDSVVAERKRLRVTFSEPMDPSVTPVRLINTASGAGRALSGTWAPDALSIELTILRSEGSDHPLDEDAPYALDLRMLRDAAGNALDTSHPYLGNGILNFKTIASDAGLNHTCLHTLFGPFEAVSATAAPDGAPSTSATHTEYTIALPSSGGEHTGYTGIDAASGGTRVFYFNQLMPFELYDTAAMTALPLTVRPVPDACPGITHYAEATLAADTWHHARFGPVASPQLKMVIEPR